MNKLFVVLLAGLVGAIMAAPSQRNTESDIVSQCLNEILDSLESENVEELADVLADARLTIQYLAERHRRCQELPRDDPPTRLQEIAISSCENAWRLNVAIELARLTAAVSPHVENGRDLAAQFSECSGIELPTPPPPAEEE
ncbi:hypothetical protein quinque_008407 [Culex quinquefasciatus]